MGGQQTGKSAIGYARGTRFGPAGLCWRKSLACASQQTRMSALRGDSLTPAWSRYIVTTLVNIDQNDFLPVTLPVTARYICHHARYNPRQLEIWRLEIPWSLGIPEGGH